MDKYKDVCVFSVTFYFKIAKTNEKIKLLYYDLLIKILKPPKTTWKIF